MKYIKTFVLWTSLVLLISAESSVKTDYITLGQGILWLGTGLAGFCWAVLGRERS